MDKIENPARKGDIVAYEVTQSSASPKHGTKHWTVWKLGEVAQASRDGAVKKIRQPGYSWSFDVKGNANRVATIKLQDQARRVFDGLKFDTNEFKTADDLRNAILAA